MPRNFMLMKNEACIEFKLQKLIFNNRITLYRFTVHSIYKKKRFFRKMATGQVTKVSQNIGKY